MIGSGGSSAFESGEKSILCPLTLNSQEDKESVGGEQHKLRCLCCDECFDFLTSKDDYLAHLFLSHRLVIADVEDIADLEKYLKYWANLFQGNAMEQFCTTLLLDQLPDGTPSKNEKYYLLSDILPQDNELRKQLYTARLEDVLKQHQFERTDRTFERECLYCRDVIKGLRAEYLEHLFSKHFLQLGKPENLVFIDELIQIVQDKLENLICLYCEKLFKDRLTLKEHMRKKGHKRINPSMKLYDKFFLINYKNEKPQNVKNIKNRVSRTKLNRSQAQVGNSINWKEVRTTRERDGALNSEDSDSDWSDWDEEKSKLTCLFCIFRAIEFSVLKNHMKISHDVDFEKETAGLNFYQKVKVVNYIRRQVHTLKCVICNERCKSLEELQDHMTEQKHYGIGSKKQWDQPEYFFPTYEDDGVLCLLDDENDFSCEDSSVVVISEDIKASINKDAEALSLENFVL